MPRKPKVVFFSRLRNLLSSALAPVKEKSKSTAKFITSNLKARPITSFAVLLLLLFALIALSHQVTKPKQAEQKLETQTKEVETFNVGQSPTVTLNAQVQKSGVVQIVAQAPGIVSKIHTSEGKTVTRGTTLISTGANYQGASAASVSRQLAQTQYTSAKTTTEIQKELIKKQREIAEKTDSNADELRSITDKSLGETRDLIFLNENILSTVDANLKTLEDTNTGGANDALILQTKQAKAQLLAGLSQAKSGLRGAEYAQSGDKPAAQLSDLGRDATQKQLDLQEKSLELNLEVSRLQVKLAQIGESVMFPSAPFAGTVQRVHIRVGQTVSPGTPLVTLSSSSTTITATALVPKNVATNINKLASSYLLFGDEKIETTPVYVSTEATNGQLYSVIFAVPEEHATKLTDLGFIEIEVPIGQEFAQASYPFIPLDSIQQTQDTAVVFVEKDGQALGKNVTLGQVQGSYAQIIEGLETNDKIILNRNVISGDKVKINNAH